MKTPNTKPTFWARLPCSGFLGSPTRKESGRCLATILEDRPYSQCGQGSCRSGSMIRNCLSPPARTDRRGCGVTTLGAVGVWLAGGSVVAWTGHLGLMDSLLLLCGDDRPGFKDQRATRQRLLPPSQSWALGPRAGLSGEPTVFLLETWAVITHGDRHSSCLE